MWIFKVRIVFCSFWLITKRKPINICFRFIFLLCKMLLLQKKTIFRVLRSGIEFIFILMMKKSLLTLVWIAALAVFLFACKADPPKTEIPQGTLQLNESFDLAVPQPSGLAFGPEKNTLLTVSDNTSKIYELNLNGQIERTLAFTGSDLEGISYNPIDSTIAVVEEGNRKVVFVDYVSGLKVQEYQIDIESNSINNGLEGLSYRADNFDFYILNEKDPRKLVIWNPAGGISEERFLTAANDFSGVFVDVGNAKLWLLSDESASLFKCDYHANVLLRFPLDMQKYEGIAIDDSMVFLVNDATAKLNSYQITK